jgi:hypothetical protein
MSRISSVVRDGNTEVTVEHQEHTFNYTRPTNARAKQGRTLTITSNSGEVVLGGRQINAVKRILEEAGEISTNA